MSNNALNQYFLYRELYEIETLDLQKKINSLRDFKDSLNSILIILIPYNNKELLLNNNFQDPFFIEFKIKEHSQESILSLVIKHLESLAPNEHFFDINISYFSRVEISYNDSKHEKNGIIFSCNFLSKIDETNYKWIQQNYNFKRDEYKDSILKNMFKVEFVEKNKFCDFEIYQNKKYRKRYIFHNYLSKKILRKLSRFIGRKSLYEMDSYILKLIIDLNPRSFIDIACGDNKLCLQLSERSDFSLVVGNDISFSQVELLKKSICKENKSLLFTNHDASKLPFSKKKFDVAFLKNTIHHLENRETVISVINEALRISRRLIIVEILNPENEGWWGRLRHSYYLDFLKDAFVYFYNEEELEDIFTCVGNTIHCRVINTINGSYKISVIEDKL